MSNNFIRSRWFKCKQRDNNSEMIRFVLGPINFRNYQQSYFEIDNETKFDQIYLNVNNNYYILK